MGMARTGSGRLPFAPERKTYATFGGILGCGRILFVGREQPFHLAGDPHSFLFLYFRPVLETLRLGAFCPGFRNILHLFFSRKGRPSGRLFRALDQGSLAGYLQIRHLVPKISTEMGGNSIFLSEYFSEGERDETTYSKTRSPLP